MSIFDNHISSTDNKREFRHVLHIVPNSTLYDHASYKQDNQREQNEVNAFIQFGGGKDKSLVSLLNGFNVISVITAIKFGPLFGLWHLSGPAFRYR